MTRRGHIRRLLVVGAACGLLGGSPQAGRLFGNASFSYEHITQEAQERREDDLTRETAIINYEDVLFYKNSLRLTANLQRRELSFSDRREFQPIYNLDLRSYGYSFNARYSPFKRRGITVAGTELIDVYYRDWRLTAQLNYNGYPTLSAVYSRLKNFDREEERRYDAYNRNLALESSYTVSSLTLRANYANLQQVSNLPGGSRIETETYSSTVSLNESLSGVGFASASYNYYDSRREANQISGQKSFTHSINSLVSLSAINRLTVNASYSGRFLQAEQQTQTLENDNQNISAQAEYMPTDYLSLLAGKGYQKSSLSGGDDNVTEYINLGATATRYLRNGVDTRLTYNRTIFQRSPRMMTVVDTSGAVVATVNDGDYIIDAYQASLNFFTRAYVKTYLDVTLTHDSDPVDPSRRYQLTRSLDVRANFTRRLEGRFRVTSLYNGDRLRLDRSFSQSYNLGVTYIPRSNLNFNATYMHTDFGGAASSSLSSVTGYVSYSFRRAFSLYVSVNRQIQKRGVQLPGVEGLTETETRPRSVNGQILIYLSSRTTLSTGYIRTRASDALGQEITNESIQTVLSIQI